MSDRNAARSAGVGRSPVRSYVTRRSQVSAVAAGAGRSPRARIASWRNASTGFAPGADGGITGRGGENAQWLVPDPPGSATSMSIPSSPLAAAMRQRRHPDTGRIRRVRRTTEPTVPQCASQARRTGHGTNRRRAVGFGTVRKEPVRASFQFSAPWFRELSSARTRPEHSIPNPGEPVP